MVKCIGNDVFICKYTKSNVFLICVHKPKATKKSETEGVAYTSKNPLILC